MGSDAVSWNIYRYAADYIHLGGLVLGLAAVLLSKSVEGFSRKTQVLYQIVFVTRYLDVFVETQVMYLLVFKLTFILITASMNISFVLFAHTYDANADSCNIVAMLLPTALCAYILSAGSGLVEELWTWSELVEPFALVPQYIVCYRAKQVRPVTLLYVLLVGGYRVFYVMNWIYKRTKWHGAYHDYTSWFGGMLECVLFFDFTVRIAKRQEQILVTSVLGKALLHIDEGAGRLSEAVEMRTLGRRLPYGMSGLTQKEEDVYLSKSWDATDQLVDEESCKLLTLSGDADGSY